jgi:hypothetical protein
MMTIRLQPPDFIYFLETITMTERYDYPDRRASLHDPYHDEDYASPLATPLSRKVPELDARLPYDYDIVNAATSIAMAATVESTDLQ